MAGKKKTETKLVLSPFKVFLYIFLVGFVLMIFIGYSVSIIEHYTVHVSLDEPLCTKQLHIPMKPITRMTLPITDVTGK